MIQHPERWLGAVLVMVALIARAADAPDRWGQTPDPKALDDVKQAVALSQHKDFDGAEAKLRAAVGIDPQYYAAQLNLGLVLIQSEDDDAVPELLKAKDIAQKQHIEDHTIYAELAFAQHRADKAKDAENTFLEGITHLSTLKPEDQIKLMERGIAFYLDYQNPAGARAFLHQASVDGLDLIVKSKVQGFLEDGVRKLTSHDVPAGWVRLTKQPPAEDDPLFGKVNGLPGPIMKGDVVTPSAKVGTVNIRADKPDPKSKDETLPTWTGIARLDERFDVLEVATVERPDAVSIWMHIKRRYERGN